MNSHTIEKWEILDGVNAIINEQDDYFVIPIKINIDNIDNIEDWDGTYFYPVVDPNGYSTNLPNCTLNLIKINEANKREMKVYYSHVDGKDWLEDIFADGSGKKILSDAFYDIGVSLTFVDLPIGNAGGNTIPVPANGFRYVSGSSPDDYAREIIKDFKDAGMEEVYLDGNTEIHNKEYLAILNNYQDDSGMDIDVVGQTVSKNYPDAGTRYSFIWSDRLDPTEYESVFIAFKNTILHELAHAKGSLFPNRLPYYSQLTNEDNDISKTHEKGHNGKGKQYCLLRYLYNAQQDSDVIFDKAKKTTYLCEGHRQMILNSNWNETEEAHDYE